MKKLSESGKKTFVAFVHLLGITYEERPDVPPTREEILMASRGEKKDIKALESLGLIQGNLLSIREGKGGTVVSRNCYSITKLGEEFAAAIQLTVPQKKVVPASQPDMGNLKLPESPGGLSTPLGV
jgi:hypothetical protein